MSISHIYQPAILLVLLENGGDATVAMIAKRCAELRPGSVESYAQRLLKYPKEALTKHGVITATSNRNDFKLALDIASLPEMARQELIDACTGRLAKVK